MSPIFSHCMSQNLTHNSHILAVRLTERLIDELERQLLHVVRVAQPEDFKNFLRRGSSGWMTKIFIRC